MALYGSRAHDLSIGMTDGFGKLQKYSSCSMPLIKVIRQKPVLMTDLIKEVRMLVNMIQVPNTNRIS